MTNKILTQLLGKYSKNYDNFLQTSYLVFLRALIFVVICILTY